METHIVIESNGRRDKIILELIKTIDPRATYAGGISSSGDRVFIVDGKPEDYTKVLSNYVESGVVKSIDKF